MTIIVSTCLLGQHKDWYLRDSQLTGTGGADLLEKSHPDLYEYLDTADGENSPVGTFTNQVGEAIHKVWIDHQPRNLVLPLGYIGDDDHRLDDIDIWVKYED